MKRSEKEKLFYHDVINSTHGVCLYLEHRLESNSSLSVAEIKPLLKEIKTIQSLMKDHFELDHKNVKKSYEWVSFNFAKSGVFQLISEFLNDERIKVKTEFLGELEKCSVYYPSFYRVLSNLIKNISEHCSELVSLSFLYQNDGLHITIKNDFYNEKTSFSKGLGLDSSKALCEELGGKLHFFSKSSSWTSQIFFPAFNPEEEKVSA